MEDSYTSTLPQNYFNDLYLKVSNVLKHRGNICISVMYGFGNKTVFNFLTGQLEKNRLFDKIAVYDPTLDRVDPVKFVKSLISKNKDENILIVIRFFEQIKNKRNILEKLRNLQGQNLNNVSFLAISDHTPLLNPLDYSGKTTIFFSECVYLKPLTLNETKTMIKTITEYFGWKINKRDHQKIYKLSGGIGRIIKYICREISESATSAGQTDVFMKNMQISFELDYLTKILIAIPKNQLFLLGLTDKNNEIKSTLLRSYFKNYLSAEVIERYPNLSFTESRILSFLLEYENETISLEKIAEIIDMSTENFSLWALYKTISRLKNKTKKSFKIINVKNKGYLLEKLIC
ncbi:MAG: hypothetical protein UX13_C0019G0008 [Candidatus Woesebacteria bacterium GW2011_GWB1_45_5]|uniref:OmpR/PhoB-type domain-containing protein n=1 Tax=Candidatus Woesebacteria bacterium GW2011_GWB1_45_5 TaxID=1618581 RepID=A0A0G1QNE6_9BACT|nr:MAG: hypothetical protein UX13_C0019G0008 [Candidatus Woesebacteria bacterium GW2011_GWB1_45_5]